ncbi:MAG: MFS transporter [Parachlamydiales bacterium]|jgi:MHS family proline/betaine transporter-like MFS transporter
MVGVLLNKKQKNVILSVTFGNILEWFEIYSYAYFAPILAKVFFNFHSELSNWIWVFVAFGAGFIMRPLGAILFGYFGDLIGRKKTFIWSIIIMTMPTFVIGILPTFAQIGILAPISLISLRLFQSIPAAGESPGTFCFLYENANLDNKRFMSSWGAFGNQIGAILGLAESFFMHQIFSEEFLMSWGWRIIFWSGAAIGLIGVFLRHKLHETPLFLQLEKSNKLTLNTLGRVIRNHKKTIGIGTAYGVINASTFYLIATYIPTYFNITIGISSQINAIISFSILFITTILLPVFGIIGDKFSNRKIMISSALMIIFLLYPLYLAIDNKNLLLIGIIGFLSIFPITCITALIPYLLADLFPTNIRFTGVGLAFNLADGIVGGFTPAISLILLKYVPNEAAFCWFILICSIVSLHFYYKKIKD